MITVVIIGIIQSSRRRERPLPVVVVVLLCCRRCCAVVGAAAFVVARPLRAIELASNPERCTWQTSLAARDLLRLDEAHLLTLPIQLIT
jgi:hypothetical protein